MGRPRPNLADRDVREAADAEPVIVASGGRIGGTPARDREDHPTELGADLESALSRLDDDGGPVVGV